jgi:hypothetical protein
MNILFICPDKNDPTAFYRASGIAHDLEKKTGHSIVTFQWGEVAITWQVLSNFDLIMLQRPFTKAAADTCLYAKRMNKPVWVDYDDNLFALNPENKAFQTYTNPEVQEAVKKCLQEADVVSVPTEYLRQSYIQHNKNIWVIPNAFNDGLFKRDDIKKREKKAIWRGPESHIYDMMSYGAGINKVTADFPDWEFLFMGYYPWFLSETSNKGFVPGLEIIGYMYKLKELAPSVGHILLHDNVFNRCRSNVGYIEMSYAGAACVVPAWWSLPGAVSYNSPETYSEAMRAMLAGEVDIEVANREAWEFIMDTLRLSKVNVQRIELINSLMF